MPSSETSSRVFLPILNDIPEDCMEEEMAAMRLLSSVNPGNLARMLSYVNVDIDRPNPCNVCGGHMRATTASGRETICTRCAGSGRESAHTRINMWDYRTISSPPCITVSDAERLGKRGVVVLSHNAWTNAICSTSYVLGQDITEPIDPHLRDFVKMFKFSLLSGEKDPVSRPHRAALNRLYAETRRLGFIGSVEQLVGMFYNFLQIEGEIAHGN